MLEEAEERVVEEEAETTVVAMDVVEDVEDEMGEGELINRLEDVEEALT